MQLFGWLVDDGEIPQHPMGRMRPPRLNESSIPLIVRRTPPQDGSWRKASVASRFGSGVYRPGSDSLIWPHPRREVIA
jgi:hypothetical protein